MVFDWSADGTKSVKSVKRVKSVKHVKSVKSVKRVKCIAIAMQHASPSAQSSRHHVHGMLIRKKQDKQKELG